MLIATDLDGTFLQPDGTPSPRAVAAVEAAERAGVPVVPVTGRAIMGFRLAASAFQHYAIVVNGAIGVDLRDGRTLFSQTTPASVVEQVVSGLSGAVPGAIFCGVVDDSSTFLVEPGYVDLTPDEELEKDPARFVEVPREQLIGTDVVKIMVRHPQVPAERLYRIALDLALPGVHATYSGFTMIEVCRDGVAKDTGLDVLCRELGQRREDVVALGDGANDVEMLRWAGTSYAMGNAAPQAVAAAGLRAPANTEDGFAQVVEQLLERM
ncbi:HAD hydrolase family protein [Acidipropionibacterium timonense]|uniref:HAD hydrolase family protein n=1 Tax=Acidipropionibacterium timonense TaxID=2161818 RepID=UPI0010301CB9|nr:HAD hydrolase family protein [Acidipropionibacterium timonense]